MGHPRTVLAVTAAAILIGLGLRAQRAASRPARGAVQGRHRQRHRRPGPVSDPLDGRDDGAGPAGGGGVPRAADAGAAKRTAFGVDDGEWRLWNNVHRYAAGRHLQGDDRGAAGSGVRAAARVAERAGSKPRAHHAAQRPSPEIVNNFEEYGEGLYHLTVMGEPSDTEPWGWQLDGHHLIVNYFVLGDQVVMTPTFMGLGAGDRDERGKYAGTVDAAGRAEQGLALMQALTPTSSARRRHRSGEDRATTRRRRRSGTTSCSTTPASARPISPRRSDAARRHRLDVRRQHGRRAREGQDGRGARN